MFAVHFFLREFSALVTEILHKIVVGRVLFRVGGEGVQVGLLAVKSEYDDLEDGLGFVVNKTKYRK